jgi:hypothetical protein
MLDSTHQINEDLLDFIRFARDNYRASQREYWTNVSLQEMLKRTNVFRGACEADNPLRFLNTTLSLRTNLSASTRFGFALEAIVQVIMGKVTIARAKKEMLENNGRLIRERTAPVEGRKTGGGSNKERKVGSGKASAQGMDIDVERGGYRYMIQFKSGGHSDNSRSGETQDKCFQAALNRTGRGEREDKAIERQPDRCELPTKTLTVIAYGTAGCVRRDKGPMMRLAGQTAWWFLTGDPEFYLKLVRIFNEDADKFEAELVQAKKSELQRLLGLLREMFVDSNGKMNWEKLTRHTCAGSIENAKHWYTHLHRVDAWFNSEEGRQWRARQVAAELENPQ